MKDYYKILGLEPGSSQDEIKKAYRLLALKHHPDRNNGNRASEELFKEIAESYYFLGDAARRHDYDNWQENQKNPVREQPPVSRKMTPATFLTMFRNIKEKIFNAGGHVNEQALFRIMNGILSSENIRFLVKVRDIQTNRLIIDEILISSVFLKDASKLALYGKLLKLANGDPRLIEKIGVLKKKTDRHAGPDTSELPSGYKDYVFFAIFLIVFIIIVTVIMIG